MGEMIYGDDETEIGPVEIGDELGGEEDEDNVDAEGFDGFAHALDDVAVIADGSGTRTVRDPGGGSSEKDERHDTGQEW